MLIGVDTGGTFTDLVLVRADGAVRTFKLPSTPEDFAHGVLEGVAFLQNQAQGEAHFDLVHSTTVATNALLERRGAAAGLITTEGFADALEIARQNRPQLYHLHPRRDRPLIERDLRRGVAERVGADGQIVRPLDIEDAKQQMEALAAAGVESVAICLLFSFLHPDHERAIGKLAAERGMDVSLSSDVLPEFREFERTSTTVANAYVAPVMRRYLGRIESEAGALGARRVRVMQSNGGTLSVKRAGEHAVHTLLSGPAAGVVGATAMAEQALGEGGQNSEPLRLITFDMGGTSTDVALIDGRPQVTTEGRIEGVPVGVPMLDIHTVGAGGGSIAQLDAGGALRVGPRSAAAMPGPACYGRGGAQPTVTDANLVLGRLDPAHFLSGRMTLDVDAAERAMQPLAAQLGRPIEAAARAVVDLANAHMQRAIRVISVERGHDPRRFVLASFGGAGGLHACDLAAGLRMSRVLIPRHPGVLSAWGAACAEVTLDFSRTLMIPAAPDRQPVLAAAVDELTRQAHDAFARDGYDSAQLRLEPAADLRYAGQAFELSVPIEADLPRAVASFHAMHRKRYGHAEESEPVQLVTVRLRAAAPVRRPVLPALDVASSVESAVLREGGEGLVYERAKLPAGARIDGPAIVVEDFSTTRIAPGWRGRVDRWGHLLLERTP